MKIIKTDGKYILYMQTSTHDSSYHQLVQGWLNMACSGTFWRIVVPSFSCLK